MLKKRRHKGVSLVELILSIAVLSFLSVYVIQMFMTSNELNKKAIALDQSVLTSENIFEAVEADRTLENLKNLQLFKYSSFQNGDNIVTAKIYLNDLFVAIASLDEAAYILDFEAVSTQALDYEAVNYRIAIHYKDKLELESIYEIEMQKYY
ncbi:type IV pilus modification PilV family protein [Fusibacter bizertensis]